MTRQDDQMQAGFTLVELTIAMAIFGFMLAIIMAGFLNIVTLHNASVATNVVQDNSQTIIADVEREIRDGNTVQIVGGKLCINTSQLIFLNAITHQLFESRVTDCGATTISTTLLSSADVYVFDFTPTALTTPDPLKPRPTIQIALTVGSSNGTVIGVGPGANCAGPVSNHGFCAVATVTGAATPRSIEAGGS